MAINFDTDPAKAEKLKAIVYKEIEDLYKKGVDVDDLDEAKKNMLKVREENLRKNGYWMSSVLHYYKHNETIVVASSYEDVINNITKEKVEQFAEVYFAKVAKIEVVMSPAE